MNNVAILIVIMFHMLVLTQEITTSNKPTKCLWLRLLFTIYHVDHILKHSLRIMEEFNPTQILKKMLTSFNFGRMTIIIKCMRFLAFNTLLVVIRNNFTVSFYADTCTRIITAKLGILF